MANKIIKLVSRTLRGILDISLFGAILVGCQMQVAADFDYRDEAYESWLQPPTEISENVHGVILPHHLLVDSFMEEFYSQLADSNSYDRIVLLSPNHFGIGHSYIQTDSDSTEWGKQLADADLLEVDTRDFDLEHGVFVHYPFIGRYFPDAEVLPIIIKEDAPCSLLEQLSDKLQKLEMNGDDRVLFLASIDFTHYTKESVAVMNDKRTISWLTDSQKPEEGLCTSAKSLAVGLNVTNEEAVAIDSPESLYVMVAVLNSIDAGNFQLWARTSSVALIPTLIPEENTSHIFGYYSG